MIKFNNELLSYSRKLNEMTLEELAHATGTSKGHIHDLEKGRNEPNFSTAWKLSKALGVRMDLFACFPEIKKTNDLK